MDNTAATTAAQSGAGATGQGLAITNARILDGSGGMIESGMAGDVHSGPVNARLLWEAGITYGYGTDTRFLSRDTLAHELKALHLVFSQRTSSRSSP